MRLTVASEIAPPFVRARTHDILRARQSRRASEGGATRRALILGAACLLGSSLSAFAEDPLASGQFRDEVVALLRRNRPDWRIALPPNPILMEANGRQVYLLNLYLSLGKKTGEEREKVILTFADAITSTSADFGGTTFESVRDRLRARIFNAAAAAANANGKLTLLTRPFSPQACIVYVIDSPAAMAFVRKDKLELWKVTADDLHSVAVENSRGDLT
jgi:hypothetical protein